MKTKTKVKHLTKKTLPAISLQRKPAGRCKVGRLQRWSASAGL